MSTEVTRSKTQGQYTTASSALNTVRPNNGYKWMVRIRGLRFYILQPNVTDQQTAVTIGMTQ